VYGTGQGGAGAAAVFVVLLRSQHMHGAALYEELWVL
jgi:hypothetical protein